MTNHRSAIDIGVVLATFGGTMVSRADLASWPVVGAAARAVGTVFVDRSSAKSGAATIRAIQKHLEEGQTINLFPEGTTFDGDEVRPFHGGAFVSAVRAEAEVLPVGLAYPRALGRGVRRRDVPRAPRAHGEERRDAHGGLGRRAVRRAQGRARDRRHEARARRGAGARSGAHAIAAGRSDEAQPPPTKWTISIASPAATVRVRVLGARDDLAIDLDRDRAVAEAEVGDQLLDGQVRRGRRASCR